MIPATAHRVRINTRDEANEKIRRQTEENIANYARRGGAAIDRRLEELDREWDIERTLEANAATVFLVGVTLAATTNRKLLLLPAMAAGFLLQHAIQGWCPPLPLFRRLGVRTAEEINSERMALKAIRGDFEYVSPSSVKDGQASAGDLLAAAEL